MTEEQKKQVEEWDPKEAEDSMGGRRLKMPVAFIRPESELPKMQIEIEEPKPVELKVTKPQIVYRPKNKNALF